MQIEHMRMKQSFFFFFKMRDLEKNLKNFFFSERVMIKAGTWCYASGDEAVTLEATRTRTFRRPLRQYKQ